MTASERYERLVWRIDATLLQLALAAFLFLFAIVWGARAVVGW